jgi:hypothetical protein
MMTVSTTIIEYVTYNAGFQTFWQTLKLPSSGLIMWVEGGSSNVDIAVGIESDVKP